VVFLVAVFLVAVFRVVCVEVFLDARVEDVNDVVDSS
jgi:hypothetical protein